MKSKVYWIFGTVFVLGLVANLAMEYYTRGQHDPRAYLLRAGLVVTAAAPGFVGLWIADRRYQTSEESRRKRERLDYLERVLKGSVQKLFPGEGQYSIRANVMVVQGEELRVLCQWNMEAYPDSRLSLRLGHGVAGAVWKRAMQENVAEFWKPHYAPRAQLSRDKLRKKWRLTAQEIGLTSHILWVLSTPILHRIGADTRFLGVFNLDGVVKDLKNMHIFEDEVFQRHCIAAAELVANEIVMGDLLPTGTGST